MIRDMGIVQPGLTLIIPFHTFDSNDPSASVTLSGLAASDIEVYKGSSMTQRGSDSGYALLDTDGIDLDGITGIHGVSIDLADNTTAGFWEAGQQYTVVISSVTIDAATVNFIACTFRIGYQGAILNTSIASLTNQTSFTLTAGPAEDDALNGQALVIHDVASAVQKAIVLVSDYTGSTKTVTLAAAPTFTIAATDNVSVLPVTPALPAALPDDIANEGLPTISKLLKYVQLITRSDAAIATDNAAERTEINADGGSGGGNWDNSNIQALQSLSGISGNLLAVLNDTGGTDGVKLASSADVYHADIDFTRDQSNTQDEYTVKWLKNGIPQSTVTGATIQVVSRDGSDLIASTAMTDVGGGLLTYDATGAERQTQGEAVEVVVTATVNAATRTFSRLLGRDST